MKTLHRDQTIKFFIEPEGYVRLCEHWSRLMQDRELRKTLTGAHHLLYLILRGKNWQTGFAAVTNRKKLENGGFYTWRARRAVHALHMQGYADTLIGPFTEFLQPEALCMIRELVPKLGWTDSPLDREPYHVCD